MGFLLKWRIDALAHRREFDMMNETTIDKDKKTSKLNIVLSEKDKKFLKIYAVERDTSVSAVIQEYVEQLRKEVNKNG